MKMLCIDGGGIRGVFAITILKALEEKYNKPVADLFDVIAGTSTGSIIAASVSMKIPMDEVLENYKKFGRKIFIRQAKVGLFKSVYSDRFLRRYLKKSFKDIKLSEVETPILIPAVDVTHGRPYVHRTMKNAEEKDDLSIELWDAVLSSCSAPVYFPPNNVDNRFLSIDGGLWANNPSLVCITEALKHYKKSMEDIRILSVGTGKQTIDFTIQEEKNWGVKQWLPFDFPSMKVTPKLLDLALHLSSESISYQCKHLLGSNYLRINKELGEEIPFDEISSMDELINLGSDVFIEQENEITGFLDRVQ
ncbi:patatin-like phospholipase family protein [Bacillus luteolus]|uniref:Patatin-like phospholipase family protein n=1 Tax=Litchfieldia luteola TaxID=682179 RepID=A0ABR9QMI8_9BACI|nr:CBASS cGAMP-activated phospholipase [Cytobacillus luteolus]MBE4909723.1 patatin-like phospholipase family protein [Cytobacillus luteolus]MBP1944535.1 patatin-like phospholipase/acyl hydrolase [Cytobacillus luteolus]